MASRNTDDELFAYAGTFQAIADAVQDYGMFLLDAGGRVRTWSAGAQRLTGYAPEEIIGRHYAVFHPPEAVEAGQPALALNLASAEGRYAAEGWRMRRDGTRFWADAVLTALRDQEGRLLGFAKIIRDLTRRRSEEERFGLAVEAAPNAMVMVDRGGRIVLVNQQTVALFGYAREELMGRSVELLVPERFRARHPRYREGFFSDPRARPMGAGRDLYGLRKDGSEVPVEIGLNPLRTAEGDFVLASIVDITERKRAQQLFRAAVESAPNGMVMVDRHGRIVLVNEQAEKLFGYSREELLGQPIEMLVPERFRGRHPAQREGFYSNPASRPMGAGRDLYALRKDKTEFPVEIGLNPIKTDEGELVLAAVVDISERKRAEEEIRRASAALEARVSERTAELKRSVEDLERFTYTVAHDLRAPLRSIHRYSELLLAGGRGREGDAGARQLDQIAAAARRMDRMIGDLLAYSKIGRAETRLEPVDLGALVGEALAGLSMQIQESGAGIVLERGPLPPVLGDRVLLGQALTNLLTNALKFVPPDRRPRVEIGAERRGSRVRLWIQDNGLGIDGRYRDRIFRIFERLHARDAYPGTGIGLAIVSKAVERLGGSVDFESAPGRGSRFWLELQAAERA